MALEEEQPPQGWRKAHLEFDRACQEHEEPDQIRSAFKELEKLIHTDEDLDELELPMRDHVLRYCEHRQRKCIVQYEDEDELRHGGSKGKLRELLEVYQEALTEYERRENIPEFLTMHWINALGGLAQQIDWKNGFDEQQRKDLDGYWVKWLQLFSQMAKRENRSEIREDIEEWLPPSHEEDYDAWCNSEVWFRNLQLMKKEFEMERIGLVNSEDVDEIYQWWGGIHKLRKGKHSEIRQREYGVGLMLMANYCNNLDKQPEKKKHIEYLFDKMHDEFTEKEIREKNDLEAPAASIIECLALAIISDLEKTKSWYDDWGKPSEKPHDIFWKHVKWICENEEDLCGEDGRALFNREKILKHLRDGLDDTPEMKENEQELYKLIIKKLWNSDGITDMQKKFFDNKFEGGAKLYALDPEVWKKRGLTYVDKGKLWKVWFNDEEIDKLVDMTNRGFGEFNPSLRGHHKEKGGPFGIKLHSWDAIPQSNEVSKLIWKKLKKYREAVQTKSHEDELRKLEEPIIDLCIRSAWRLSFIDERKSVKLDWKDGEARKSALWVRAFLGDGEVEGSGEISDKYTERKKRENPLDFLREILVEYEGKIKTLYDDAEETPYYTRKNKSGDNSKSTGMVHDDERFSNILHLDNNNNFVIDFEHSHYAKSTEGGPWKIVSVRDERPFRHDLEGGKFNFKHLSYEWEGEIYPDVLRSHAGAVANLAIETMNDKKDPLFGKPGMADLMEKCIDEAIKECEKWMEENLGDLQCKAARSLYRIHLIDRCINECLHGQKTLLNRGTKPDFEAWFRRLLDRFLDTC